MYNNVSIYSRLWLSILIFTILLEPIIWFMSKLISMVYFITLARGWPALMQCWENIEINLPVHDSKQLNWHFHRKIKLYSIGITIILFGNEILLSIKNDCHRLLF